MLSLCSRLTRDAPPTRSILITGIFKAIANHSTSSSSVHDNASVGIGARYKPVIFAMVLMVIHPIRGHHVSCAHGNRYILFVLRPTSTSSARMLFLAGGGKCGIPVNVVIVTIVLLLCTVICYYWHYSSNPVHFNCLLQFCTIFFVLPEKEIYYYKLTIAENL